MKEPEMIAHRGASGERRENTLPAFARALELGANGIELDVHTTRDGVVVVHHDFVPTAAPPVPALSRVPFEALASADVSQFRFDDGSGIPTLQEVIDLVGERATLYVELKARRIERDVIACFGQHRGQWAIHSFDHVAIKRARSVSPRARTGILSASYLVDPDGALKAAYAQDYWQSGDLIDPELVERVHRANGRVIAWTVNSLGRANELAEMGVDGICTDDLPALRQPPGGHA
jgi:glycerophosphoryl diester phosphodiesterase